MTTAPTTAPTAEADAETPPVSDDPQVGGPLSPRRFWTWLIGIVVAGLAFRVVYVLLYTRHEKAKLYDAFWYQATGDELRNGQFFRIPFHTGPSAAHPPLTSFLVGSVNFLTGVHRGTTIPMLTEAVLGALVVLFVGILGRDVAGPVVGVFAALLAAVAPDFWIPSGIIMSETPAMLVMALVLLAVVRYLRKPGPMRAALIGVACAAEALVRAELILWVPALLVPAVLTARSLPLRRRLEQLGIGVLATALVLAPWVGRNLATFTDRTYISTGNGLALLGANCPATYYGPELGSWALQCAVSEPATGDESVQSARDSHAARQYAEHHVSRLPVVVLARIGREFGFYQMAQESYIESGEGRPVDASDAGLAVWYVMLALGTAGVVIFRRRRVRQWFLLVPGGVLVVVGAVVYGLIRFRAPFEVPLAVLAAAPLAVGAERLGRRGRNAGRSPSAVDG
jgi:4-amino-4-deoxy-L-arabinose transferase-like glycosyltransferase